MERRFILLLVAGLKWERVAANCGISNIEPNRLIVFGTSPTWEDWPWIVKVYHNDKYIGGGNIGK